MCVLPHVTVTGCMCIQTVAVVEETRPKFEAFEVRTNEDERIVQRGPLPRRLTVS